MYIALCDVSVYVDLCLCIYHNYIITLVQINLLVLKNNINKALTKQRVHYQILPPQSWSGFGRTTNFQGKNSILQKASNKQKC